MAIRTISVQLLYEQSLIDTAAQFNKACQMVLDCGSSHKTARKLYLNSATYKPVREVLPHLPSALVQTAQDEASEMLKNYRGRHGCFGHIENKGCPSASTGAASNSIQNQTTSS